MIDKEKKTQYWNHFTDESYKSYRPKKITDIRLKQIKEIVLETTRSGEGLFRIMSRSIKRRMN